MPREFALPRLVDEHGGSLYGLSRRVCGSDEDAEDLVQEVFLQAWRKWDQFRGDGDPKAWLFTIARHACQRMHRKRAGEPTRIESLDELLPFGEPRLAVVPDDRDRVVRGEDREAVGAAITGLDMDFRLPLVLKDIIGFSVEEVAGILDVPKNTVKTRLHRARLKIRKALESGLPALALPPAAYPQQVCLDLLQAKQDSMDRGMPMPNGNEIICERCAAVFATLDLAQSVCGSLRSEGVLPAQLRDAIAAGLQAE